jgi:membrane protein
MFKVLPDARVDWRNVWLGAVATAALFTLGKFLIGLYLGRQNLNSTYGPAGSVILIMLWTYYSSMIFFLGAEFTQVWARHRGQPIEPKPGTVKVVEKKERVEESSPGSGLPFGKRPATS